MPANVHGNSKKIIAIPALAVKKAGAKVLTFNSLKEAAEYFETTSSEIRRSIQKDRKRKYLPTSGFYFDYLLDQDNGGIL